MAWCTMRKGFEKALLKDWDLDLDENRFTYPARGRPIGRKPSKAGAQPGVLHAQGHAAQQVHQAVRRFATEKFALQHRYAMALHTDQGHPHVHVVVKAVSEEGRAALHPQADPAGVAPELRPVPPGPRSGGECDGAGGSGSDSAVKERRDLPSDATG